MLIYLTLLYLFSFSLSLDNWKLPFNHRQKVYPNGTLMIYQVERDHDEGQLTCFAKGKQGSIAKNSLFISVLGEYQTGAALVFNSFAFVYPLLTLFRNAFTVLIIL